MMAWLGLSLRFFLGGHFKYRVNSRSFPLNAKHLDIHPNYDLNNLKLDRKVGCVFPMVAVSIPPHAEFGPNDHREDAPHFNITKIIFRGDFGKPTNHRIHPNYDFRDLPPYWGFKSKIKNSRNSPYVWFTQGPIVELSQWCYFGTTQNHHNFLVMNGLFDPKWSQETMVSIINYDRLWVNCYHDDS